MADGVPVHPVPSDFSVRRCSDRTGDSAVPWARKPGSLRATAAPPRSRIPRRRRCGGFRLLLQEDPPGAAAQSERRAQGAPRSEFQEQSCSAVIPPAAGFSRGQLHSFPELSPELSVFCEPILMPVKP